MAFVDPRAAAFYGDCSDSMPSSAASEDTLETAEADINVARVQEAVHLLLRGIGEDVAREGLRDTPKRVAKAWLDATEGYRQSTHSVLGSALFHEDFSSRRDNSIVLIQDVEFASTSEHSLLPFYGRCHIAYVPRNGVVLGLSKVARLAKMFARRLQNQQRFTHQLLEAFNAEVQPLGCAAIVEAVHLGRQHAAHSIITAASFGCFYAQPDDFMQEFVSLLGIDAKDLDKSTPQTSSSSESPCHSSGCCICSREECKADSSKLDAVSDVQQRQRESSLAIAVEHVLREVGEDPDREGLKGTPLRYVQHLLASTSGRDSAAISSHTGCSTGADQEADSIRLGFTSQCEHHLLPFQGHIRVAVIPGCSGRKLTRKLVESISRMYTCRLQIQERLTHQIAAHLFSELEASGVLLLCTASHMCMVARGVEQHASSTVTVAAYGVFETDSALRKHAICELKGHLDDRPRSRQ